MFAKTFTTVLATSAIFASTAMAAPSANSLERRDSGTCNYSAQGGQNCFTVSIDSAQDSGLCKGINDNLKGQANCAGITGWTCFTNGNTKTASWCAGLGCSAKNVQDVIWVATSPHLGGVSCIQK
ncbi:hypothetical protein GQ53DRAFT_506743 [Thozetella sp. PMI_491]|nr:hypothetical protein GQ53DRAFT_506743 [Thozetella sp. PMI_491]